MLSVLYDAVVLVVAVLLVPVVVLLIGFPIALCVRVVLTILDGLLN